MCQHGGQMHLSHWMCVWQPSWNAINSHLFSAADQVVNSIKKILVNHQVQKKTRTKKLDKLSTIIRKHRMHVKRENYLKSVLATCQWRRIHPCCSSPRRKTDRTKQKVFFHTTVSTPPNNSKHEFLKPLVYQPNVRQKIHGLWDSAFG